MLSHSKRAAVVAGVVCAAAAVSGVAVPSAAAETRIAIGGAGPLYYPNIITSHLPLGRFYLAGTDEQNGPPLSILGGYDLLNHMVGENWFPGSTAQLVNYPASIGLASGSLAAPSANDAAEMGRVSLDDQIKNATSGGNSVVVAGLSEGTLVINRELRHLATTPGAPPAHQVKFALFSSPELGLANTYLPTGVTVPLIGYTVRSLAESQYDVDVVFKQYDGWGDPPDRPWNLLAVANALMGSLLIHNNAAVSSMSEAVEVSRVTSPTLGGTTTTYMVPSPTLPLLAPLQLLGAPTQLVGSLNSVLKPMVDAGYSRLTPDAGPYFSHGRLLAPSAASPASATVRSSVKAVSSPVARHLPVARPGDSTRGRAHSRHSR